MRSSFDTRAGMRGHARDTLTALCAIDHAERRAAREGKGMVVYYGGGLWYVRAEDEESPKGARVHRTVKGPA